MHVLHDAISARTMGCLLVDLVHRDVCMHASILRCLNILQQQHPSQIFFMLPVIAGAVLCCLSLPVCSMTGSGMNNRIAAALALWWCIGSSDVEVVLVVNG